MWGYLIGDLVMPLVSILEKLWLPWSKVVTAGNVLRHCQMLPAGRGGGWIEFSPPPLMENHCSNEIMDVGSSH